MKVLAALQAFGAYEEPVSLTVLARHTELPKSTTHRMVGKVPMQTYSISEVKGTKCVPQFAPVSTEFA
ncbi:helix-turn-helix domain-containing protein [Saccharopolyspora sp. ASAGF58]|uniref:helix-turn-helix domain-containing protein n=1 Tax=Saccharopolyspora sp. ASAGF58 TaxID=2719023 RepID=UPI00144008D5|nr:helix-turn-helix domain-containing protein [Saccharopolyspora sp. ASAGF58]QIZ34085.1 hypothetical protein FDZ84_04210 [Saccharopolyspora sp. ASAGF58]